MRGERAVCGAAGAGAMVDAGEGAWLVVRVCVCHCNVCTQQYGRRQQQQQHTWWSLLLGGGSAWAAGGRARCVWPGHGLIEQHILCQDRVVVRRRHLRVEVSCAVLCFWGGPLPYMHRARSLAAGV